MMEKLRPRTLTGTDANKQAEAEGSASAAKGTITVRCGIHRLTNLKLEGKTAGEVRARLAGALNMESEADTLVNGKHVGASYSLKEHDNIEFVKLSGQKGKARRIARKKAY